MAIELRWLASTAASSLHAAQAMLGGASLVDTETSEAIANPVLSLAGALSTLGLDEGKFFEHAIPQSARYDAPLQLAEVVLAKLGSPGDRVRMAARLSQTLVALYAAFQQANPRALDELELRAEPLRGQWEARGPGLMATVARLTEKDLVVAEADVILIQPVLGGAGAAHWLYNSVRIEAVLANPIAELPEVVRLGWLLSQLNLDLPKFQGNLRLDRLLQVGPLAMIPPVLAAAQEVELARMDEPTLALALTPWKAAVIEPGKLLEWWVTYQSTSPPWTIALGALDRMLDVG
jgi:hypothetical protein